MRSENQQLNSSTLSCELYTYSISAYLIYAQTLFVGILVVTYFNPPWINNVRTNIADRFLKLIDEQNLKFKGTPLGYIFTRGTIKVSYGTTRNMKAHVQAHNKKILSS